MVRERPILFNGPMVRALLDGSKTQTRRVVNNTHRNDGGFVLQDYGKGWWPYRSHDGESGCYLDRRKDGDYYNEAPLRCPYGRPGDRLWVRETWARDDEDGAVFYRADLGTNSGADDWERNRLDGAPKYRWRPSIHMPRWASRITMEIVSVRVERLQDITRGDAMAEGCPFPNMADGSDPLKWYAELWEQINGPGSWAANPWVWVIEFKRITT